MEFAGRASPSPAGESGPTRGADTRNDASGCVARALEDGVRGFRRV